MDFVELGKKAYHEWAKMKDYTITKEQLLQASKNELELFHKGFIFERLNVTDKSLNDCEEVFWGMLDELKVATDISL